MTTTVFQDLQTIGYQQAWDMQKHLFQEKISQRLTGGLPDQHLLFCEHPHVYTFGKSADRNNLLANADFLTAIKAEVYDIERGGDITYHGPGQLVAYPLFDLEQLQIGVKDYVWRVEEAIIRTLAHYNIHADRIEGMIGIWLGKGTSDERKIAAIGIKCSRYITMHGLALNVNTDLGYFSHIVPCGITDKTVTSISKELGRQIDMADVKTVLKSEFKSIFELNI